MSRPLSDTTRQIVERASELWENVYQPADIVPTVRQYFYALAVEEIVEKSDKGYSQVQVALARARERGAFPMRAVYDGLRQIRQPPTWPTLQAFVARVPQWFALDKWAMQPRRVEVWIEKDAVRGTVQAVTDAADVPLLVDRGYLSVTAKFEASVRIAGGPRAILYIGDHDPSGVNMQMEAETWMRAEADEGLDLVIERVAITDTEQADPGLPHLPVNPKDPRAADYVKRYGHEVVEVEALPPEVLQARLRNALDRHRDAEAWAEGEALEAEQRTRLVALLGGEATP